MKAQDKYERSAFELYAKKGNNIRLDDCPYDDSLEQSFWYMAVRNAANACEDTKTVEAFHPKNR